MEAEEIFSILICYFHRGTLVAQMMMPKEYPDLEY
jgi:hypothetical protein